MASADGRPLSLDDGNAGAGLGDAASQLEYTPHARNYPRCLVPPEFTHLHQLFKSKNTIVYRARRAARDGGGNAQPSTAAPCEHVVIKMPNIFATTHGSASVPMDAVETPMANTDALSSLPTTGSKAMVQVVHTAAERIRLFLHQFDIAERLQGCGIANLVHMHEVLEVQLEGLGLLYPMLVFDYFDGPTLQSHLSNPRYMTGFPKEEWFPLAFSLTETLASIHAAHVIHCDLSDTNVLYNTRTHALRLIDFGLSTPFPGASTDAQPNKQFHSTLAYLSPEQTGHIGRIVDHRTDIFSLGVLLYQALTGRLPFKRPGALVGDDADHLVVSTVPPTPRETSPHVPLILSNIIMKCMAKDPDLRYASMLGLLWDLRSARHLLESADSAQADTVTFPLGGFGPSTGALNYTRAGDTVTFEADDIGSPLEGTYEQTQALEPSASLHQRRPSRSSAKTNTTARGHSRAVKLQELDLQTILHSIQAISRELVLHNLIARLMKILMQNTGAQTVTLLSQHRRADVVDLGTEMVDEWKIDASLESGSEFIYLDESYVVSLPEPSPRATDTDGFVVATSAGMVVQRTGPKVATYPQSLLDFVLHSQKSVILADAVTDKLFGQDPSIVAKQPRSVMCLPLHLRGALVSVLYLEHSSVPAVFTRERLLLCRMITQQAMVSIETARLYSTLETKVAERTRQLNEATERATTASVAKSVFLANMSHEIRTPMNAVLGVSRLLESTPLSLEQQQYITMLNTSGQLLLNIVNDILDYSKMEAGEMRIRVAPCNLADVVEAAVLQCYGNARAKGLELTWFVDPSILPVLLVDESRLQQILLNLLSNAIKFTKHGNVALAVSSGELPPLPQNGTAAASTSASTTHIKQATTPDEHVRSLRRLELRFEVRDTGIGISPEQLAKLFQSFSQVRHSSGQYGGTGLGLVISERLVAAMGGDRIHVDSQLGRGSIFSFRIVCHPSASSDLSLHIQTGADDLDLYGTGALQRQQLRHVACVIVGNEHCSASWARLLRAYGCDVHIFPAIEALVQHIHTKAAHCQSQGLAPVELDRALHHICDVIVVDLDTPGVHEDKVLEKLALFSPVRLLFTYSHAHLVQNRAVWNEMGPSMSSPPTPRSSRVPTLAPATPASLHVSVDAAIRHFPHVDASHSTSTPVVSPTARGFMSHSIRKELPKPFKTAVFLQAVCDLAREPFLQPDQAGHSPSLKDAGTLQRAEWPSSSVTLSAAPGMSQAVSRSSSNNNPTHESSRSTIFKLATQCPLRILLAEDNLINQKMMVMLLRKLGYEIKVVANGVEALQLLEHEAARGRAHEIECILMDASMDTMDGFECTRVIRSQQMPHRVRPFIIAQTANVTDDYRRRCAESGMDLFLPKPIELGCLTASLQAAYAAHHPHESSVFVNS